MKGVDHCSLLEYLREDGQTCNMLIRRHKEGSPSFYTWIAFRVKTEKGGEPVVTKRVKQSVGPDINNAEQVHKALPGWACRTKSSTLQFRYDGPEQIRLVSGQSSNNDRYLGFFVSSGALAPKFTTDDFVLNMHKYTASDDSVVGTVVAFSMNPRRSDTEMHCKNQGVKFPTPVCCFDRSSCVDEEDETEIDGEACLSGSTRGPLMLNDFPSCMTNGGPILGNSRMFLWTPSQNGNGGFLSTLSNSKTAAAQDEISLRNLLLLTRTMHFSLCMFSLCGARHILSQTTVDTRD
eukprot:XP_011673895.1 PREDICTED: uncharacterized protein LOC105442925 [Strongylocentrotus purpuratus]